jgi:hypothetical protein
MRTALLQSGQFVAVRIHNALKLGVYIHIKHVLTTPRKRSDSGDKNQNREKTFFSYCAISKFIYDFGASPPTGPPDSTPGIREN